jgi:hypothetical protein
LAQPTDFSIFSNGNVTLATPLLSGTQLNIITESEPIRLDDPNYGTVNQTNTNAIMSSITASGSTATFTIPNTFTVLAGDRFIWRQSTSDGSIKPQDTDYDTALSGGNLTYSTATGLSADDILVDGDGLVTPTTSPAPEEVVPGQVVDAVAIKVFDQPITGSASIKVDNYLANGSDSSFIITQTPSSPRAVVVKVGSTIKEYTTDYTVDYKNSRVNFTAAPAVERPPPLRPLWNVGCGPKWLAARRAPLAPVAPATGGTAHSSPDPTTVPSEPPGTWSAHPMGSRCVAASEPVPEGAEVFRG